MYNKMPTYLQEKQVCCVAMTRKWNEQKLEYQPGIRRNWNGENKWAWNGMEWNGMRKKQNQHEVEWAEFGIPK